jgi:hypothetical protein
MEEMRNAYRILVGKLKGRDHLDDLGVDTRIMLKWILKKFSVGVEIDPSRSGQDPTR